MVPEEVLDSVPMLIGEAKLPAALLSCNVNAFPVANTPDAVNEISTFDPAQVSVNPIGDRSIVADVATLIL